MLGAFSFFGYLQKRETGLRTLVWVFIAARIAHTTVGIVTMTFGWSIPHLTPSSAAIVTLGYRADVVVAVTAGLSRGRPWITGAADTGWMQRGMECLPQKVHPRLQRQQS